MSLIGLGASSLYPYNLDRVFGMSKDAGYDGVEVLISHTRETRDAAVLDALRTKHDLPILSLHAPTLILTHFTWGRDPEEKMRKTALLARDLDIPTIVVHPPYAFQKEYAARFFQAVREVEEETGVLVAVENMFPWKVRGRTFSAYAFDSSDIIANSEHTTLDFSHASLAHQDSLDLARQMGERLQHVHLCDGAGVKESGKDRIMDEHALPGEGSQPVAETLEMLTEQEWTGSIVAEINLRKFKGEARKMEAMVKTVNFARTHTNSAPVLVPAASSTISVPVAQPVVEPDLIPAFAQA